MLDKSLRRRKLRQRHREQGVCDDCGAKATHGWYCIEHWRMAKGRHRKSSPGNKEMRKKRGLCTKCRRRLEPETDAGYITCIACRERLDLGSPKTPQRRYYDYLADEEPPDAARL